MIFLNFPCENNGKFMNFSRRREMSLEKPKMSLVKFQNVPGKCFEDVATLKVALQGAEKQEKAQKQMS